MRSANGWQQPLTPAARRRVAGGPGPGLPGGGDAQRRAGPLPPGAGPARQARPGRVDAVRRLPVRGGGGPRAEPARSGWRSAAPGTTCGRCAAAGSGSPTWTSTPVSRRSCAATCSTAPTPSRRPGPRRAPPRGSRSSRNCSPPRRSSPAGTSRSRRQASTGSRSGTATSSVTIPPELAGGPPAAGARPGRRGARAGRAGSGDLGPAPGGRAGDGRGRGASRHPGCEPQPVGGTGWHRVELLVRQGRRVRAGAPLEVSGLLHMVGMVGAGKSTLRDILTYWYRHQRPAPPAGHHRGRRRGGGARSDRHLPPDRHSGRPSARAVHPRAEHPPAAPAPRDRRARRR